MNTKHAMLLPVSQAVPLVVTAELFHHHHQQSNFYTAESSSFMTFLPLWGNAVHFGLCLQDFFFSLSY